MRKYFMELFAMGFVDSEGNLVEENVLRDAQRTAALTAKIMKENLDNTWEMESHLKSISFQKVVDLYRVLFYVLVFVVLSSNQCYLDLYFDCHEPMFHLHH